MQESRRDFLTTYYGGMHCGATVLTTVVYLEMFMLFYTIGLPIAEALNYNGVPALFRFVDPGNRCVVWRCGGIVWPGGGHCARVRLHPLDSVPVCVWFLWLVVSSVRVSRGGGACAVAIPPASCRCALVECASAGCCCAAAVRCLPHACW